MKNTLYIIAMIAAFGVGFVLPELTKNTSTEQLGSINTIIAYCALDDVDKMAMLNKLNKDLYPHVINIRCVITA